MVHKRIMFTLFSEVFLYRLFFFLNNFKIILFYAKMSHWEVAYFAPLQTCSETSKNFQSLEAGLVDLSITSLSKSLSSEKRTFQVNIWESFQKVVMQIGSQVWPVWCKQSALFFCFFFFEFCRFSVVSILGVKQS